MIWTKRTGQGADRSRARRSARPKRRSWRSTAASAPTCASRATRATTSGASSGYEPRHHVEVRQALRHGHDRAVRRREPAARAAQRRGDRASSRPRIRRRCRCSARRPTRRSTAYFDDAASATPEWRAASVETAIALSKKKEVVSAGFVETQSADAGRRELARDCSPTTASPPPTTT